MLGDIESILDLSETLFGGLPTVGEGLGLTKAQVEAFQSGNDMSDTLKVAKEVFDYWKDQATKEQIFDLRKKLKSAGRNAQADKYVPLS